jgi:diacylglycerol kinase
MKKQPLYKAFGHAFNGLFHFIANDRNGRIHFIMVILVCLAGFYLAIPVNEWIVLLLCFAVVIGFEMCNHALENLCNVVHIDRHPLIRIVKDVAAAAVLWSAIISIIIGLLIFIPKIYAII